MNLYALIMLFIAIMNTGYGQLSVFEFAVILIVYTIAAVSYTHLDVYKRQEDLGYVTDTVRRMVKESGYPNMKVLEFAFDSRDSSGAGDYLPHNYEHNCVAYTGTHDNETILGLSLIHISGHFRYLRKNR